MTRYSHNVVSYAPFYIHSFQCLQTRFLADSEKFNITYSCPALLSKTSDKLRYYRYKKSLLQQDVADYLGIERSTYSSYESEEWDYYPPKVLERIAELLEVNVTDLLDDYNAFIYYGQGWQVKALRKQMKLTQAAFAAQFGVCKDTVLRWEKNERRMYKKTWEKVFL
jgi:transcriptional regulator with XRE-family HTH domain